MNGSSRATSGRSRTSATARWGSTRCRAPVNVSIAVWPWGAYLGDEGLKHGVRMKISVVARHGPQHRCRPRPRAPASTSTRALAKVEALKAGYDEAILLNPQGYVSECTGENIFVVKHGVRSRRRSRRPASPASPRTRVMTIARDLGFEVPDGEHPPQRPLHADEAFLSAPPPRSCRSARSTTARSASPARSPARSRRPTSRPCGARSTSTRTGWNMSTEYGSVPTPSRDLRHDAARRSASSRASRSPSTTSCASPSSSTTSASTTSRRAGPAPTPRTTSSSAGRRTSCSSSTSTLVAFGSTRRPKGKVDRRPTLRHLLEAGTSTVCIVGKSWDYHVTEALRTTLDEGAPWSPTRSSSSAATGARCSSTPSTSSTATSATPSSACGARGRGPGGAPALVLCDTNGGTLPHEVERIVREVVAYFGGDVGVAVHLHDDAGTGVANALAGVRRRLPGAGHDQRLRRAHRQLQPHHDHPEPHAEDGRRDDSRDRLERLTPVRTTSPSS